MWNEGVRTFKAGEDLEAKRRVKIESGTTNDPPEVVYADAGEDYVGITEYAVLDGKDIAVRLITCPGTFEVEVAVSSAIARGTVLYGAADGKLSDASSGSAQAVALEAAGAGGDHLECLCWSVKSTTAATVSLTAGAEATVEAEIAAMLVDMETAQATIPIPLGAITMEDGTVLTKQATTVTGIAQLANKEQVITIPIDCSSGESLGFTVPVPQDLDDSEDIVVHVLAGKGGALDVLTLDCEVYPCGVGDTANADIQDTAATTITEAASELTFTCGADGVLAAPGTLSVILALGGTNDGDAVYIYGAWVEYTRKLLAA